LDWRAEQNFDVNVEEWTPLELSAGNTDRLLRLSVEIGVEWGRYDFMINESDELVFLEFNANGQFVFLDYWDKFGIMDAVISYLRN
jgi:D-alanine-D-alanine ligase-like ATP-grasp enzyme